MIDLKKTLEQAGLTQTQFAEELGESKQRVNYWIKKNIPMATYIRLMEWFGKRAIKVFYVK